MSDIDDKLRELDLEFLHGVPVHLNEGMVAQIKQVFTDEGYQKYTTYTKITTADGAVAVQRGLTVMTGQEWYDRFEKALLGSYHKNSAVACYNILEAAKEAAGL